MTYFILQHRESIFSNVSQSHSKSHFNLVLNYVLKLTQVIVQYAPIQWKRQHLIFQYCL